MPGAATACGWAILSKGPALPEEVRMSSIGSAQRNGSGFRVMKSGKGGTILADAVVVLARIPVNVRWRFPSGVPPGLEHGCGLHHGVFRNVAILSVRWPKDHAVWIRRHYRGQKAAELPGPDQAGFGPADFSKAHDA